MMKKSGMVDIGRKRRTRRTAVAQAFVRLPVDIIKRIKQDTIPKGDVLEIARVAGIMAAKKTSELIPLCHIIEVDSVDIEFLFKRDGLLIRSRAKAIAKTGVEMEAMASCSIAALTIYDMCKMFSKSIEITGLYLVEKRGGKSGIYRR